MANDFGKASPIGGIVFDKDKIPEFISPTKNMSGYFHQALLKMQIERSFADCNNLCLQLFDLYKKSQSELEAMRIENQSLKSEMKDQRAYYLNDRAEKLKAPCGDCIESKKQLSRERKRRDNLLNSLLCIRNKKTNAFIDPIIARDGAIVCEHQAFDDEESRIRRITREELAAQKQS